MMVKRKTAVLLLCVIFCFSALSFPALAAEKTLYLEEDWRLTDALDINAGAGNVITIDGGNKYVIYEMNPAANLTNTSGIVRLKDVKVIYSGSSPAVGSLAQLQTAATSVSAITAPARDATFLSLPVISGFAVSIKSSSKTDVIALNGTVTPPSTEQAVLLVLKLTGNGGEAETKSISVTVPAKTTVNGGPGSSDPVSNPSGNSNTGGNTPPSQTQNTNGTTNIESSGKIEATPVLNNESGKATVTIDMDALNKASSKAGTDASGKKIIPVEVKKIQGANTYVTELPAAALSSSSTSQSFQISTDAGSLTAPSNMLGTGDVTGASRVSVSIGAADKSKLPQDVQKQVGNRTVVELSLQVDGATKPWSNPDAPVTVTIPYKPTAAELADPEHIVVWYIDGSGNAVSVPSGRYDPVTGMVTFNTSHFSKYAVAYVMNSFNDLEQATWARKAVEVLASKGILQGITGKEYAPKEYITRADFLSYLVKTLGTDARVSDNFSDVSRTAYYYRELGVAKKLGITSGIGNNKFSPEGKITRQDMFVMADRALEVMKKTKQKGKVSDLEKYTDNSLVSKNASVSVATVIKEGLVTGSGSRINPTGYATRAEAAVFLYRIYNKY